MGSEPAQIVGSGGLIELLSFSTSEIAAICKGFDDGVLACKDRAYQRPSFCGENGTGLQCTFQI